jgi:hypothetical protein
METWGLRLVNKYEPRDSEREQRNERRSRASRISRTSHISYMEDQDQGI